MYYNTIKRNRKEDIIQCNVAQHKNITIQHNAAQYNILQHNTAQHSILQRNIPHILQLNVQHKTT